MLKKENTVRKFAAYSLIVMLFIGALLNYAVSFKIEDMMVERTIATTAKHAQQKASNYLTPEHFYEPDYLKDKEIFEKYYSDVKTNEIVRIKLYNKNRTIIYSDAEELVGRNFPENEELGEALAGSLAVEIKRDLTKKEQIYEREYNGLMEIYVPMNLNSGSEEIVGVVELYQTLDFIDREIKNTMMLITSLIIAGLLILYLSLIWIVNGASNTIVKQNIELKKAYDELKEANKVKTEFMHTMSHEMRTPLNAVIGFSELLKQNVPGKLNESQKGYVEDILKSSWHLLGIINDILDLSKIETGKTELIIETFSLPQAINEALDVIKEKAAKRNVNLKLELDPELEFIEADKQKFNQIIFNLLSNAVKFSKPEGGVVTIKTKKEGTSVRFSISDTGIGIKEKNIGKLFKEFEQIDSGISRKYGGTGLGLAITKKLVELHGGTITVESKYGSGSTFTFVLPLRAYKNGI